MPRPLKPHERVGQMHLPLGAPFSSSQHILEVTQGPERGQEDKVEVGVRAPVLEEVGQPEAVAEVGVRVLAVVERAHAEGGVERRVCGEVCHGQSSSK